MNMNILTKVGKKISWREGAVAERAERASARKQKSHVSFSFSLLKKYKG